MFPMFFSGLIEKAKKIFFQVRNRSNHSQSIDNITFRVENIGWLKPTIYPLEDDPVQLSAEVSPRRVKLLWTQPEGRITFRVYRNNEPFGTVTGDTFWDSTVEPAHSYQYRVEALAEDQPAIVSQTVSVKTPGLNILQYELRAKIWRYGEPEPSTWNVLSRQEQSWEVSSEEN